MRWQLLIACLLVGWFALPVKALDLDEIYEKPSDGLDWGSIFSRFYERSGFAKSYALVIGMGEYDHWHDLDSPVTDAERVRDFLINDAGFDYVITLTNAKATKPRIQKLMEEFFPDRLGEDDRFLFYFSGHGVTRPISSARKRGYLPLKPAGKTNYSSMIGMNEIGSWADLLADARQTLFILDSCFSGLAGIQRKSPLLDKKLDRLSQSGHHLITAGTGGEESIGSLDKWGGSLFTSALLNAVSGKGDAATAEYPKDGVVSLKELMTYVENQIDQELVKLGGDHKMSPQISDLQIDNAGEFFFLTRSHKLTVAKTKGEPTGELKGGVPVIFREGQGASSSTACDRDLDFALWNAIKDRNNPGYFDAYIKRVESGELCGLFVDVARLRREEISDQSSPQTETEIVPADPDWPPTEEAQNLHPEEREVAQDTKTVNLHVTLPRTLEPARSDDPPCGSDMPTTADAVLTGIGAAIDGLAIGTPVISSAFASPEARGWLAARLGIHNGPSSCNTLCAKLPSGADFKATVSVSPIGGNVTMGRESKSFDFGGAWFWGKGPTISDAGDGSELACWYVKQWIHDKDRSVDISISY